MISPPGLLPTSKPLIRTNNYSVWNCPGGELSGCDICSVNGKGIFFSEATWIENKYQSLTIFLSYGEKSDGINRSVQYV